MGLYQETVLSYDLVTASGELIHVTADNEHADLFYCLPWSHGTLGFLVALELQLIRIKPYVHLQYIPVSGWVLSEVGIWFTKYLWLFPTSFFFF